MLVRTYYYTVIQSSCFLRRPQKWTKSSSSIWHLLHNVKLTVKISSNFVAFLENINFKKVLKYFSTFWSHHLLIRLHAKMRKDLSFSNWVKSISSCKLVIATVVARCTQWIKIIFEESFLFFFELWCFKNVSKNFKVLTKCFKIFQKNSKMFHQNVSNISKCFKMF